VIGILKEERPQQGSVDHAEDRRVRSNPHGQGEYHNQRKRRLLRQRAGGVAQVLPDGFHGSPSGSSNHLTPMWLFCPGILIYFSATSHSRESQVPC
jgi:hypothetical protein